MSKQTREEYLAGSLSRLKPWEAEGVSRITWYRRQKLATSGRRKLAGADLVDVLDHALKASGAKPKALARAIEDSKDILPAPYKNKPVGSVKTRYNEQRRARRKYQPWIALVRNWAGPLAPMKRANDIVNDFVTAAGSNRAARIGELFDHLERQWRWDGKRKLSELQKYQDGLKADPLYWPKHRPTRRSRTRGDADAEAILKLVRRGPRTRKELMRAMGKSGPTINNLTVAMCRRGQLVKVGLAKWALPGSGEYASASNQIVAALIKHGEMPAKALRELIGRTATASTMAIHTLRRNGVLAPADYGPVRLSPDSLVKVRRGEPIRGPEGRGGRIFWAPANDTSR
jgi:hypothetical protein